MDNDEKITASVGEGIMAAGAVLLGMVISGAIIFTVLYAILLFFGGIAASLPERGVTNYDRCTIVSGDKTYVVLDRFNTNVREYDGAVHFYSGDKRVVLNNYELSCEYNAVQIRND